MILVLPGVLRDATRLARMPQVPAGADCQSRRAKVLTVQPGGGQGAGLSRRIKPTSVRRVIPLIVAAKACHHCCGSASHSGPSTSAVPAQATTSCGVLRSASTRANAASTSPAEVTSAATARRRPTAPSASRGSAARSVPGRVPGRDCALAGEMNRDRLADPAARAGHNSDLPGQRCRIHGSILTQPAHPLAAPEIVAAKRAQPLQWGVSLKRLRDRCDSRLTCIGSGPQVLVYWPDGFSGR